MLAAAVYSINDPTSRVFLGILLLAIIMALTVRLAKVEVPSRLGERAVPEKRHSERRFLRLRNTLERFVDEVRLLNRIAVDAQRGFRSRDSAELEMRQIESRLEALVKEFRSVAGVKAERE
jgi:hypothetical protein